MNIGIVGAGLAGLSCAGRLAAAGHAVSLYDKGRGPGGRMSTRRAGASPDEIFWDHGATAFTATSPAFVDVTRSWQAQGIAAPWTDVGESMLVGVPGMNAIVRAMVDSHDVAFSSQVKGLVRSAAGWSIVADGAHHGPFDAVLLAIPAEQAAALLSLHDFAMARLAAAVSSEPCWTAMLAFAGKVPLAPALIDDRPPFARIVRNSGKPGRTGPEAWVLQASTEWSQEHLEETPEQVLAALTEEFAHLVGAPLPPLMAAQAHRWRFARPRGTPHGALWNPALRLGACGDWLTEPTVEGAWTSGTALADRITQTTAPVAVSCAPPTR